MKLPSTCSPKVPRGALCALFVCADSDPATRERRSRGSAVAKLCDCMLAVLQFSTGDTMGCRVVRVASLAGLEGIADCTLGACRCPLDQAFPHVIAMELREVV
eukprot:15463841-Alexandrium_andersonii.AAC.1